VTGGARGLGKSVTEKLLDGGAMAVICDLSKDLLNSVCTEYSERGQTLQVQCDGTDYSAVKSLVEKAVKHFGQLDVLLNCADIVDRFEPVGDVSQDLWEKVLAVNLTGTFLLCKEVLNHFLSRGATDASILNIGSLASESGWAAGKL
jgi:NAD(P)-dependent dehydrogenase (short-subunit alcohol dehydrogenase family)